MTEIKTSRLTLRQWQEADRKPFSVMCADSAVMRYFPATLNEQQSDAGVDRLSSMIEAHGFGFWAAELTATGQFIGFVGLNKISHGFEFAPCVEIGWRLQRGVWGQGLATEAALASLNYGFYKLQLDEIVAMTPRLNTPSENVMKKIGMEKTPEYFLHPKVPSYSPLYEHVLYRLRRDDYCAADQPGDLSHTTFQG